VSIDLESPQLASSSVVEVLLAQQPTVPPLSPFGRWHLRKKFQVMEELFRKYLSPNARFADIACGSGDALVLASLCEENYEMWGVDMDRDSLSIARQRLPSALLHEGDMHEPAQLPKGYFDVVHEFGATFFSRRWDQLARSYLSLLRPGGILLWELPRRWSAAHLSYLLSLAPKRSARDSKIGRIFRSFFPSKYHFASDAAVHEGLQNAGYEYEILEEVPIWYFFAPRYVGVPLNWLSKYFGERVFEGLDRVTRAVWPRPAGYYLIIRKTGRRG
jgi:SAM-dependent methyltransferase